MEQNISERTRRARKAGIASFIGTTIEWYDFYAYSTAAALVLGKLFFPATDPGTATLAAFATFWVGFFARPVGGIFFGHLGDRIGRKKTLVATLLLMGCCTTLIGFLPVYENVGIVAPILLVVLRLIQGLAMGGEWGGAVVLSAEHAPKGKSIFYAAFAQQGSPAGNMLATLVFLFFSMLPDEKFLSWGWRLPFMFSAILVIIGLIIRISVDESPEMEKIQKEKAVARLPIAEVLKKYKAIVLLGIGATIITVTATYFKTTFALAWAVHEKLFSRTEFLSIVSVAIFVQLLVQPFGAILASKFDLRKTVTWMLIPEIFMLPLMFSLIETKSMPLAMIGMALATVPHSLYYAALAGILVKAFPTQVRYTAISVTYQVCSMIFAGSTPMIAQYLLNETGTILSAMAFAIAQVVITLICAVALIVYAKIPNERDEV